MLSKFFCQNEWNPNSFPAETPKAHFKGWIWNLYCLILSNAFLRWRRCCSSDWAIITISSMYTSNSRPTIPWNMLFWVLRYVAPAFLRPHYSPLIGTNRTRASKCSLVNIFFGDWHLVISWVGIQSKRLNTELQAAESTSRSAIGIGYSSFGVARFKSLNRECSVCYDCPRCKLASPSHSYFSRICLLDMASGFNCERQINECTWTAGINKGNACLSTNSDLDWKCASSDQPWNCMSRNMHEILIWRGVLILWDFISSSSCTAISSVASFGVSVSCMTLIVGINLHLWPGTHFSPHLQHSPAFLALCCCTWGAAGCSLVLSGVVVAGSAQKVCMEQLWRKLFLRWGTAFHVFGLPVRISQGLWMERPELVFDVMTKAVDKAFYKPLFG